MKFFRTITILTLICIIIGGCRKEGSMLTYEARDIIPAAPDYSDTTQWYSTYRNYPADVFYITSTETGDYTLSNGSKCHYADTYNDSIRQCLFGEMRGVDRLLSGSLNFFSPYYRQCTLESFVSDSLQNARMQLATDDVRKAFNYYINNINQGRPFVLAGFSQGALIMIDLLKEMSDDTYNRMIAAYTLGISISEETVNECKHIVGAKNATDTGVTICYNSVSDKSKKMWEKSAIAINPVNWRTDSVSATLITEPTPLLPTKSQKKDTMNVHLDTESALLIVRGYSATDYILPLIGKEGNYHSREIWLYRQQLRENITDRTNEYLKKH